MAFVMLIAPVLVAIVVAGASDRPSFPLVAIAVVAVVEVIAIVVSVPSFGEAIATSLFVVVFPWAVIASFVHFLRRWKRRGIVAMLVPPLFFLTFGIAVVVGVNAGVLRV